MILKKRFLGKATGHNDHYKISMGGQRPKIGGNKPLTGLFLQCWISSFKLLFSEISFDIYHGNNKLQIRLPKRLIACQ